MLVGLDQEFLEDVVHGELAFGSWLLVVGARNPKPIAKS